MELNDYHARLQDPQLGRWWQIDELGNLRPHESDYCYVGNNPTGRIDPDGKFWDAFLDIVFVAYDIGEAAYQYATTGNVSTGTKAALAADLVSAVVPFVTGGGVAVRTAAKVGEVSADAAKTVIKINEVGGSSKINNPSNKKGTIYKVPGEATTTGKSYIGRHNQSSPQKTRKSNDGRDRTKAEVIDTYNPNDKNEGRYKEQKAIDEHGGTKNLDNKRNEVNPNKQKELEKVYGNTGKE